MNVVIESGEDSLMALELVLLTETFQTKAALKLVDFVVQNLNVFLEIRVAVESCCAEFTCIAVFMALCIMLKDRETLRKVIKEYLRQTHLCNFPFSENNNGAYFTTIMIRAFELLSVFVWVSTLSNSSGAP